MTLPSGTVTFLFTDIEGSTKLWEEQPDTMRLALARHDALLRSAIETNGGVVFKTMGDAFCAAFSTAPKALEAALMAQQSLLNVKVEVGSDLMLKVRMALHTGTAEQREGDYFGQPLNRVARLLSVGHGGQVLVSEATHAVVGNNLPPATSLLDLGLHRLKDLQEPEHIWQLIAPDLLSKFPPLRSLSLYDNNLPIHLTSFIGREKQIEEVKSLLTTRRLLTLTGSGGCGKTRLSLQVAADVLEQFPDGVWLIELAPLSDPSLAPQTVAEVLGIREAPGEPITKTMVAALKEKSLLLVLDNCEHVLETSARLVEILLKSCPKVKVLVSSREALGIAGESAYRVPSLSLPDLTRAHTPQSLSEYEAARLFIERAVAAKVDFVVTPQNAPALASVCHRLDGIPLAIELAAARIRSMTVEELGKRLEDRFHLLTGGSRTALPRHRTLLATVAWSYDLLEENQKVLLARLSVFRGGWTLEACEQICSGGTIEAWEMLDLLTALCDKSLIIANEQGDVTRYSLLETVRQYAGEKLAASGEAERVRQKHQHFYLALAEEAEPLLVGSEQGTWMQRVESEHDNLRAAMDGEDKEASLRIAGAILGFWNVRGYLSEGRARINATLTQTVESIETTPARAKALQGAGVLAFSQGDHAAAWTLYEQSLERYRALGDRWNIASLLNNLGNIAFAQGDYMAAHTLYKESLEIRRELGDKRGIASSLVNFGNIAREQGDYTAARTLYEESLALLRELADKGGSAYSLLGLGMVASCQGDYAAARTLLEESLEIRRELGDKRGIATSLNSLGNLAADQGDYMSARTLLEESLEIQEQLGDKHGIAIALINLGMAASDQGNYTAARTLYEQSLAIQRELGDRSGIAYSLNNLGGVASDQGDHVSARTLYEQSLAAFRELGDKWGSAYSLLGLGMVASHQGDYAAARTLLEESLGIRRELGDQPGIASTLEGFATLAVTQKQLARSAKISGAANRLREEIGAPLPPNEQEKFDLVVASARQALGKEAFSTAWEEGRAMSMEQASSYALQESTNA